MNWETNRIAVGTRFKISKLGAVRCPNLADKIGIVVGLSRHNTGITVLSMATEDRPACTWAIYLQHLKALRLPCAVHCRRVDPSGVEGHPVPVLRLQPSRASAGTTCLRMFVTGWPADLRRRSHAPAHHGQLALGPGVADDWGRIVREDAPALAAGYRRSGSSPGRARGWLLDWW